MDDRTEITWAVATVNKMTGCTVIVAGCRTYYAGRADGQTNGD